MSIRIHESIAKNNTVRRIVNYIEPKDSLTKTKYDTLKKIYPTAYMLLTIGVAQAGVILASDDMPKERRIPMALNNVINCVISFVGGLAVDKYFEKLKYQLMDRAKLLIKDEKRAKTMINGIDTAVPVLVSAFLYKYIGQVIATPVTDKVNKYMIKHGMVDYSEKKQTEIGNG